MEQCLRKIWCCLRGGHRYADVNLESYHFPSIGFTCFRNVCVKCGKPYVSWVRDKELFRDAGGRE